MSNHLISLCMIVKNEEDSLERCLHSVYRYLDEIILVDTGSTDRTVEIAKRYTDDIYHFQWINDFSAARNVSLRHATGKWILYLDADDYMEEKDIANLREVLSRLEPREDLVFQLPYVSLLGEDTRGSTNISQAIRVFPNHMDLQFHRPIHEQVYSTRDLTLKAAELNIPIYHTGYKKSEIEKKNKHERNLSIFQEMKKHTDYNAYDYFTLGNQFAVMGNHEEALENYEKAIAIAPSNRPWVGVLYFSTLDSMMRLGKNFEAWAFSQEKMTPYAQYSDVHSHIASLTHSLGFWELSKQGFLDAIALAEKRTSEKLDPYILSPENSMTVPLKHLAQIYEKENNIAQSIYYLTKLLIANSKDIFALSKLVELMSLNESVDSISTFLDKLLDLKDNPLATMAIAKVTISIGNRQLAERYVEQGEVFKHLETHEVLRYHLLRHDRERFAKAISNGDWNGPQRDSQLLKYLALGVIVWDIDLPSSVFGNASETLYLNIARKLRHGTDMTHEPGTEDALFDILTDLYLLKQDDAYGDLIERHATNDLINGLTSYFFQTHQSSIALQYASHLLDNDALSAENSIHLAFLYLGQQNAEEALNWLDYALKLKPKSKDVILLYCSICNDPLMKEEMKQRLLEIEPRYESLALFHSL